MGTVAMIIGITADILAFFGCLGTKYLDFLAITAVGLYGVPILVVLGIVLGSINIFKNKDAEQKKRGRTGLLCSILGIVLYIIMFICIVKFAGNWDIQY